MTHPKPHLPVVAQAMAKAGVKLPTQMQMIWTWLKDNPRKRLVDIRSSLPITPSGVSALLTGLRVRGMIKREREHSHLTKKLVSLYSAVGDVYELLPEPRKDRRAGDTKWTRNAAPNLAEVQHELTVIEPKPAAPLIDSLTIGEARALYAELKKLFG